MIEEGLPLLRLVYGLSRQQALELPSWEFDNLVGYAHKHIARGKIDTYQMVSLAAWGSEEERKAAVEKLSSDAGYGPKQAQKSELPTPEEMKERYGAGLAMIPSAEEMLKRRNAIREAIARGNTQNPQDDVAQK